MIEVKGYDTNIIPELVKTTNPIIKNVKPLIVRTINGYTNPAKTVQNIGILKNASTYFNVEAERQGWTFESIPPKEKITRFIILRDPYERYLSGLTEDLIRYLSLNNQKQTFFNNLFQNNFLFDFFDFLFENNIFTIADHTQLQVNALELAISEIGIENMTFIKLTNTLGDSINVFLQGENCKASFSNFKMNEKNRSENPQSLYQMVHQYFQDARNRNIKAKLLEHLELDYKLINSITFFNRI